MHSGGGEVATLTELFKEVKEDRSTYYTLWSRRRGQPWKRGEWTHDGTPGSSWVKGSFLKHVAAHPDYEFKLEREVRVEKEIVVSAKTLKERAC